MSNNRKKWSEFERIFNQTDSTGAISFLKENFSETQLREFVNKYGKGLIHLSVELDKPKVTEYLLSIGCEKDQINRQDGRSPLALALSLPRISDCLIKLVCEPEISYAWSQITGYSRTLEFGNEMVARLFRWIVINYLISIIEVDDDNLVACSAVVTLQRLDWPLESLSFLRLDRTSTHFAQLFYATADGNAVRVKHCLDSYNYSPRALMITLKEAVFVTYPRSTVIMKLLIDHDAPHFTEEFHAEGVLMLDEAFWQNDVDKVLVLMQIGIKLNSSMDFFGTDNTCLDLFIRPKMAYSKFFERTLPTFFYKDYVDGLVRYHSRIEGFTFPQELKTNSKAHSNFLEHREELARMEHTLIHNNLSLLDILDMPLAQTAVYVRNRGLMNKLKVINFKKKFPCFSGVITKKLEVACQLKDWTEQTKSFLAECLPVDIVSNHIILSRIVSYLGVPNLIVMSLE